MADNTELFGSAGIEEAGQTPGEPSTSQQGTEQPKTEPATTPAKAVDDWTQRPEYRELQRKYEAQRKATEREKLELAARLNAYEQQLDQLQTRDLDEPGKLAYENQKLKRLMSLMQQQQQEQEGRNRVFGRISQAAQAAGLTFSPDILAEASDADDAWERAFKHFATNIPRQASILAEKREANAVDLGGGAASGVAATLQAQYDQACKLYDTGRQLELMHEADMRGVQLRL